MSRSLLTVALACGLFALAGAGCHTRVSPTKVGGASGSKPDAARKQAEAFAASASQGAADALARVKATAHKNGGGFVGGMVAVGTAGAVTQATGQRQPAAPATPQVVPPQAAPITLPKPTLPLQSYYLYESPLVVKVKVSSTISYPNEADAEEDAIVAAADVIERKLAELDPPVRYRPTPNEVRNEFLRRDSRTVRPVDASERAELEKNKLDPRRVYVEYEVGFTAAQVRELRTSDRLSDALKGVVALTVAALAGFLFLRLDEYTKGYLTRWLAVGAVALAGAAAAALYFV